MRVLRDPGPSPPNSQTMQLRTKATLFFAILVGLLTVALAAISLYAFRSFSIAMASEHIRTAAEIVRVHLTDAMINGTIGRRESFLNRLMEVQGLKSARVYRSPSVVQPKSGSCLNAMS
ncbi:MAG: hypothetical protein OHK0048_21310 [Rhodoferax sp.]